MTTPTAPDAPFSHRLRRFHTRLRRAGSRTRLIRVLCSSSALVEPELDRFLDEARAAGTLVLDGRAEGPVSPPYALAGVWLRGAGLDAEALLRVVGGEDQDLGDEDAQSSGESLLGVWERIRRALQNAAGDRPMLLVARDAHRADPDTRALLGYLAGRIRFGAGGGQGAGETRHGLVVLARAGDGDDEWAGEACVETVEVGDDAASVLDDVLAEPRVRERLLALGGGSPERLRSLLLSLPAGGVAALREAGLRAIGPSGRALLEILAVLGRSADLRLLTRVLREPVEDVEAELRALETGGHVQRVDAGYALPPHADAASILLLCPQDCRLRWHAAVATALGSLASDGEHRLAMDEERARHLLLAGELEIGAGLAMSTAQALGERSAPRRGLALLDFAQEHGAAATVSRALDLVRADLLERLGDLDVALTLRRGLFDDSRDGEERAAGAQHLGTLLLRRGDVAEAAEIFERGREAAEEADSLVRVRIAAGVAEAQLRLGDVERAERIARAALAEASLQKLQVGVLAVGHVLGKAQAALGLREEAAETFRRVLDSARALERPREEARALYNLGVLALGRGAVHEAGELFTSALALSERGGHPMGVALAQTNLAVVRAHQNRLGEAIGAMQRAVAAFEDLGLDERLCVALADLASLLLAAGDTRAAARAAARGREIAEDLDHESLAAHCALREAEVSLEQGHLTRAERGLREAERQFAAGGAALDHGWTLYDLARVAEERREAGEALGHLEALDALRLAPDEELGALGLLLRARVRLMQGRPDAAEAALDAALPALESAGRPIELAEALQRKAALLSEAGRDEEAARLREEARALVQEIESALPESLRAAFRARRPVARVLAAIRRAESAPSADTQAAAPRPTPAPAPSAPELTEWRGRFPEILGDSRGTRRVLQMIDRFAAVDSTVVILGESGTGKELVARAIYRLSGRRRRPFVRINAAALTESLLLSELFGHERGAFTGADRQMKGAFERAHGGTLFLDEIGDISANAQVSLLRVLQEREIMRVGGTRPVNVDVRVICATNRDLEQLVAEGRFRLDLYHRIRGLTIAVPPLRERPEDIPPIAAATLSEVAGELGHAVGLAPEALDLLGKQPWPGNVRELQNVLRSAAVLTDAPVLSARDLVVHAGLDASQANLTSPATGGGYPGEPLNGEGLLGAMLADCEDGFSLSDAKRELEVACIKRALARTGGNITHAAPLLGMKRPRLSQKIKELGIKVPR